MGIVIKHLFFFSCHIFDYHLQISTRCFFHLNELSHEPRTFRLGIFALRITTVIMAPHQNPLLLKSGPRQCQLTFSHPPLGNYPDSPNPTSCPFVGELANRDLSKTLSKTGTSTCLEVPHHRV